MYIAAIAWAYVILMMAVTSGSLFKGLSVAVFLGVLPLWLFMYVADSSRRKRSMTDETAGTPNAENSEADQK
jgi:ABC-type uncharacterized transport system permease subunit